MSEIERTERVHELKEERLQDEPKGAVQRICLSVQLHPLFVTEADRSYCVQCVYVEQHILSDFEQSISIRSIYHRILIKKSIQSKGRTFLLYKKF